MLRRSGRIQLARRPVTLLCCQSTFRTNSKSVIMSISVNLDDDQSRRLEERARELGVDARDLAKAAVNDLLCRQAADFERAAKSVLDKNREL